LTKLTNLLYQSKLTDQPTCYKVFKKTPPPKDWKGEQVFTQK